MCAAIVICVVLRFVYFVRPQPYRQTLRGPCYALGTLSTYGELSELESVVLTKMPTVIGKLLTLLDDSFGVS